MSLKGFLTKHSGELGMISSVFGGIIGLLPIGNQDKRRFQAMTFELGAAAERIKEAADNMPTEIPKIDHNVLKDTLHEILPGIVTGLVNDIIGDGNKKAPAKKGDE